VKAARRVAQGKPVKLAADPRNDFEAKEAQVSRLMSARQNSASDNLSFAENTARAIGKTARSVQRDARRGEKIDPRALEIIEGTVGDKGVNLDALARLDPSEQVKAARRVGPAGGRLMSRIACPPFRSRS